MYPKLMTEAALRRERMQVKTERTWGGDATHRFVARFRPSSPSETSRTCITCHGTVRRSWVTGILHRRCRYCRYLVMMYGPSIEVTRKEAP